MIIEFTRGLAEETGEHDYKVATKTQAYPSTLQHFLRKKGPGVEVLQQTYIMSCHGVGAVEVRRWGEQLGWWGMKGPAITAALQGCMLPCIQANHNIANV